MTALQLLEQYEGLIESRPSEISIAWKGSSVIVYFVSSLASYACAILFYVFWYDICGHCVFWAEAQVVPKPNVTNSKPLLSGVDKLAVAAAAPDWDWTKDVQLTYQKETQLKCKWFHITCLLSCYVSTTGLVMFLMCGRGGYDTHLFASPWRIVLPWLIINFVLMIMTISSAFSFSHGYYHFSQTLLKSAEQVMRSRNHTLVYEKTCQAIQIYTHNHNKQGINACAIHDGVKVTLLVMTWCWICAFAILLLRILATVDFTLLRVKVYRIPDEEPERTRILDIIRQGRHVDLHERKDSDKNKTLTVKNL